MNTSILVLLFWGQRGARKLESKKCKRSPFVDYADESYEEEKRRTRGTATRGGDATAKGACRSAAAPDEAAWVNPSLADATGLEDVNTGRLVEFMLSDECRWYLTNGKKKVQLLRNERGKNNQDAVWTWFGDGKHEYCYRSTPDIKDVPGFRVPAYSGSLTGEGWQLMHEVDHTADSELAKKVRAGKTWVNYGLFELADLEALMQQSSDLGSLMSRNKDTNHTFCDKGIYKVYVGPKDLLKKSARWTHDYKNSKLLGTITMHTGKEKSDAIVCSDADGSFSTITVTAQCAAYKGEPGGVVFDPKTPAVCPLLYGSAVAITFELGCSLEKSRIVRAANECIVCYSDPPFKIPDGLTPFASCGHQDVCEECLLGMYERRQANCPQCRKFPFGGDDFMTLMRIMAQKKKIGDEHDALLEQMKKIERQLQKVNTEKAAMDRLSKPHMLQITSLGVSHEVAKEALEANDQNLELAITSALDITAEQAKEAKEEALRAEEEALRVYNTQWHDLKTGIEGSKLYKIQVVVKDGDQTIQVFQKTEYLREYHVLFSSTITVEIHNHSQDDLEFKGKYVDHEEDSTECKGTLSVQAKKKEQPAHYTELWHKTFYRSGEYRGDEFVLTDVDTNKDILSIRLKPVVRAADAHAGL